MRRILIFAAVALSVVMLGVMLSLPFMAAQAEDVSENAVSKQITYTLYGPTAVTTSTVNTSSPATDAYGRDMSATNGWSVADVFIIADGTGTWSLTATPQLSPDASNWTGANWEYVANSFTESATTTITNTGAVTSTSVTVSSLTGSATVSTQAHSRTMTSDGTEYMRIPLAGEYLRVQLAVTGAVTPTVKVTYRN